MILSFITDHHFSASISKLDVITQIAAFLGVVCTVIMGVSRRDRDLIMGLVNVILFLAFQQPDGILQSHHEDIISEMPQSVNVALVKFDLNSHTTIYAVCYNLFSCLPYMDRPHFSYTNP